MHVSREALVVIELGAVHGATVVPEHNISLTPFVLVDELVILAMAVQLTEQFAAFHFVHSDDVF